MYSADVDSNGILRMEIASFLSRASAEAMFLEVQRLAPVARARHGGNMRAIGVTTSMPVQNALVLDHLARISKLVFARPGDRAALIINSVLLRNQMKRVLPWERIRICADETEARAWLLSLDTSETFSL